MTRNIAFSEYFFQAGVCASSLAGESKSCEDELCTVTFLDLKCDRRKRKFRHLPGNNLQTLMSAEFEMQVRPVTPTGQLL